MVDIERLLVALLRNHSDINDVLDQKVYVELPSSVVRPVCRLSALGGLPRTSAQPPWLTRPSVDFDVWGVTKNEAFTVMDTVREVLLAQPRTQTFWDYGELVFVSATDPFYDADSNWPDADGRPGPRYHMTTRITAHPTRS